MNLANASIGPEGAKFIAKALHGRRNGDGSWVFNTTLRTLNLEFNSIGTEGVIAIASALCPRWVPSDPNVAEYVYGGGDGIIRAAARGREPRSRATRRRR